MITMVEKIARAIAVYQYGHDDSWKEQLALVRVMLDAIRDPTAEMWASVVKPGGLTAMEAAEIYTAMIDGARASVVTSQQGKTP